MKRPECEYRTIAEHEQASRSPGGMTVIDNTIHKINAWSNKHDQEEIWWVNASTLTESSAGLNLEFKAEWYLLITRLSSRVVGCTSYIANKFLKSFSSRNPFLSQSTYLNRTAGFSLMYVLYLAMVSSACKIDYNRSLKYWIVVYEKRFLSTPCYNELRYLIDWTLEPCFEGGPNSQVFRVGSSLWSLSNEESSRFSCCTVSTYSGSVIEKPGNQGLRRDIFKNIPWNPFIKSCKEARPKPYWSNRRNASNKLKSFLSESWRFSSSTSLMTNTSFNSNRNKVYVGYIIGLKKYVLRALHWGNRLAIVVLLQNVIL